MQGQQQHDDVFNSLAYEHRLVEGQTTQDIGQHWQKEIAERKGKRSARLMHRRHQGGPHKATTAPGDSKEEYLGRRWRLERQDQERLLALEVEQALCPH